MGDEDTKPQPPRRPTRRRFLRDGALALGALCAGSACARTPILKEGILMARGNRKPNLLFLMSDQLSIDAIAAHGCADVRTPNLDRLARRGVTFMESYSTNPLCSPARSSHVTGRMPVETSVVTNMGVIDPRLPNLGQWFGEAGYESIYCGKWHIPFVFQMDIPGFTVLPAGPHQADLSDAIVSRSCQTYFLNRSRRKPFMMVASLSQPHDICGLTLRNLNLVPEDMPFAGIADRLPTLAPNHGLILPGPKKLRPMRLKLSEIQWRYYNYIYYRMVEMLDADVGRILDALEDSGEAGNTLILFSSDHGESRGRHGLCAKWHSYDEAAKVPLIVSWPRHIPEGRRDETHLVSGLDAMPTFCDFAGVTPPPLPHARSLRPLLEEKPVEWRDYIVFETQFTGRTVRTAQYKYVDYSDDPVKQLFDMKADPWETRNLYDETRRGAVIEEHRRLLKEWESRLEPSKRAMSPNA